MLLSRVGRAVRRPSGVGNVCRRKRESFAADFRRLEPKVFPRTNPREDFTEIKRASLTYGVGSGEVVVVVVVESMLTGGVIAAVAVGRIVVLVVVFVVAGLPAGEGLMMVVLLSAGEAAGVTVSVLCSHAAKSAAPARMGMNFFIFCLV